MTPRAPPGRNDPCPCGSGRKFKHCCALAPRPTVPAEFAALGARRRALRAAPAAPHLTKAVRLRDARAHLDLGTSLLAQGRGEESLASFERAIELDPKLALAHYRLGVALMELGREGAALGPFERAAALAPKMAEAHRRRGFLLHAWGRWERAAAAFRAAAAAADTAAQRLCDTAAALRVEGRVEEAEAALSRAKALDPAELGARVILAQVYAQQGRFGEAEQELRSVLAREPGWPSAASELFQFVKAREADRPLLAEVEARAARPDLTPHGRMLLGFALGRAYELLGDYATAIRHFDAANAIRGAIAPLDRGLLKRQTDWLITAFPPGSLATNAGEREGADERPVFILGLPRSGTTLVEQILSSHPEVAAGGEIGFWPEHGVGALGAGASEAVLAPLAAQYRALLDEIAPGAARITDKNPFNFIWIGLLRRALPRARIVHVRRTPIDNAVSLYTTFLTHRRTFFFGNREHLVAYCENYVRLMEHWRAVLSPEGFLDIDYEAVVRDRENETRRLVAFCGLEWDEACLYPEKNTRAIDTASLWQARQPVYTGSIGRWRNYAPWLGPLLRLAPAEETAPA